MPDYTLTIIIPVYNEAENITQAIARIEAAVTAPHTISVVYDSDDDPTVPVARATAAVTPTVRLLKNKYGRGALNAIKTGLESAAGTYAVVTMADLSDPPEVINDMYAIAGREGADIVCASRYMRGGRQKGGPPVKGLLSRLAGLTLYWFAGLPTHDPTNSFKLYRTAFLRGQTIESSGGFELGLELVVKAFIAGRIICETPTVWTDREAGKSNFRLFSWLPGYLRWYFYAFRRAKEPDNKPAQVECRGLLERIKKYRARFFKYVCAGMLCALINWSLFFVFHYIIGVYYLLAGALAFVFSTTANYFLSAAIFVSRGRKKAAEFLLVTAATGSALALDLGVMYLLVDNLGVPPMPAKVLGTGSAFVFNYTARQFFIFDAR